MYTEEDFSYFRMVPGDSEPFRVILESEKGFKAGAAGSNIPREYRLVTNPGIPVNSGVWEMTGCVCVAGGIIQSSLMCVL